MIRDTLTLLLVVYAVVLTILGLAGMPSKGDVHYGTVPFDVDQNVVCFQDGYQSAECIRFDNVYHEDLLPFEIEGVNPDKKILFVQVDSYFTGGSDGACESFGWLMVNMLDEMPAGWKIFVTNEWVPSKENPISKEWAAVLAEGY
ncbi:MAG: hypothetical protein ACWGQW_14935 [bacterium]